MQPCPRALEEKWGQAKYKSIALLEEYKRQMSAWSEKLSEIRLRHEDRGGGVTCQRSQQGEDLFSCAVGNAHVFQSVWCRCQRDVSTDFAAAIAEAASLICCIAAPQAEHVTPLGIVVLVAKQSRDQVEVLTLDFDHNALTGCPRHRTEDLRVQRSG